MKLTFEQAIAIRELALTGISQRDIAKVFNTSRSTIGYLLQKNENETKLRYASNNIDINRDELIYIAGYFDGEGCITISNNSSIRVSIANTYKPLLDMLCNLFGGNIYVKNKNYHNDNWRVTYEYVITANKGYVFLTLIIPFLKEKRKQAELAIKFHEIPKLSGNWKILDSVKNDTKELKEQIKKELSELKKVEY